MQGVFVGHRVFRVKGLELTSRLDAVLKWEPNQANTEQAISGKAYTRRC